MESGCRHLGCEKDELSHEKKVRVPGVSERLQEFEKCVPLPSQKPVVFLSDDFAARRDKISPSLRKSIELYWPGFSSNVSGEAISEKLCPEDQLVEDEGLQSSDGEEDLWGDEDEEDDGEIIEEDGARKCRM